MRAGNVIAFGTAGRRGKEGIVVVAETREPTISRGCTTTVVDRVCDAVGIPPLEVVFVAGREPAQDVVGQAPALAVQDPVPRRRAHPGLSGLPTAEPERLDATGRGLTPNAATMEPRPLESLVRGHAGRHPHSEHRGGPRRPPPSVAAAPVDASDLARLVIVLLAFAALLRLPAFFVDVFNSDETFLATQAQVIENGGNLYEEAADRKPPLVPYVYAAAFELFGTNDLWSVRVLAIGAAALTALLLALEARRRYGRRAAWAAGLLCVFALVAFAPQDGQAANFEIFMLPAMTAAVLLARRGTRAVGRRGGRGRDARQADRRVDARPGAVPRLAEHAGAVASPTRLGGFMLPLALVARRGRRRRSSSTGRCSATART